MYLIHIVLIFTTPVISDGLDANSICHELGRHESSLNLKKIKCGLRLSQNISSKTISGTN